MQQEELDNLIGDEFDEIIEEDLDGKSEEIDEDIIEDDEIIDESSDNDDIFDEDVDEVEGFEDVLQESESDKNGENEEIIPPPADNKNKVVAQLDEVTKESEEKATQILDIMDEISANVDTNVTSLKEILEFLNNHKNLCEKLHEKFPHIKIFEKELNLINEMIQKADEIVKRNETTSEKIFTVMDIMQYQDIHRQKIERVINIIKKLLIMPIQKE